MPVQTPTLDVPVYQPQGMAQAPQQAVQPTEIPSPQAGFAGKAGDVSYMLNGILNGWTRGRQAAQQHQLQVAQNRVQGADYTYQTMVNNYNDLLKQGKQETDPEVVKAKQAATQAWQSKLDIMQNYVEPQKPEGKGKGGKETKKQEVGNWFSQTFGKAGLTPEMIPQASLQILRNAQPPGVGLSEAEKQQADQQKVASEAAHLDLQMARETEDARKTYFAPTNYNRFMALSEEDVANLSPEDKTKYNEWRAAGASLQERHAGSQSTYQLPDGSLARMYADEAAQTPGAKLYVASDQIKPGGKGYLDQQYAASLGMDYKNLPPAVVNYLDKVQQYRAAQSTISSSEAIVVDGGLNYVKVPKTSSSQKSVAPPVPPEGWPSVDSMTGEVGRGAKPQTPAAPIAPTPTPHQAAPKKMASPPGGTQTGVVSGEHTKFVAEAEAKKNTAYVTAQEKYDSKVHSLLNAINTTEADKKAGLDQYQKDLQAERKAADDAYNQAVHALGGTPNQPPPASLAGPIQPSEFSAEDDKGHQIVYRGGKWVDPKTGKPTQ